MSPELKTVRNKYGWQWRVYQNGRTYGCFNYFTTERDAINDAISTYCKKWSIEGGSDGTKEA